MRDNDGFNLSNMIGSVISRLRAEIERIDDAIRKLAAVRQASALKQIDDGHKRGRKEMSSAEREVVRERMRRYWEEKRKGQS